jgi:hypothetical protein
MHSLLYGKAKTCRCLPLRHLEPSGCNLLRLVMLQQPGSCTRLVLPLTLLHLMSVPAAAAAAV